MSTILTETEGFTPVIDVLAQELGLMTAVVYGIVWRYCQMENKVCSASRETIAEHANISVKTVDRHLDKLCEAGYLKDLHPEWKHRPHIYADTGKLKIEALVKVKGGETESPTSEEGRTESPTGETESPTGKSQSPTGETESPTKILSYDSSYDSQLGEKDAPVFPENPAPPIPASPARAERSDGGEGILQKGGDADETSIIGEKGSPEARSTEAGDHQGASGAILHGGPRGDARLPSQDDGSDHAPVVGVDPLLMPFERRTAAIQAKGGNYADPGDDVLAAEAIVCLCGGKPPKRDSGTWHDMINTLQSIHADWGLHDREVGEALGIVRAAIALFLEEKQQMAVYKYPSFAANYGHYLSRAMNGDTREASPRRDPGKFDRATAMTRERLGQHGHR